MNEFLQDVRYGARMWRKTPGLAAVAVLSIALGIAANTTVFSWIQEILLSPLRGAAHPGEVFVLPTLAPSGEYIDSSYPDFQDFRDEAKTLAGVVAAQDRPLILGEGPRARTVWAQLVSGNFFDVLGVRPARGRFFSREEQEDAAGAHPVAVISHALWRAHFGGDQTVVGREILLNRQSFTVVGIAPEEFRGTAFGLRVDLYVPVMMQRALSGAGEWTASRPSRPLKLLARLAPGVTVEEARTELRGIAARLAREYPNSNKGVSATLLPVWRAPYGAQSVLGPLLLILLGVCGLVLLIVCANVANLLLARATTRQREIGVRLALGAARGRLLRQLLTESLLLSLAGAAVGVLLTFWSVDFLMVFLPTTHLPIEVLPRVNGALLAFTALLAMAAALVFGLAPALMATRPNLYESLKEGGRSATAGGSSRRLRNALVTAEVALALAALVGTGLFVKSFQKARAAHPGFDARNVLLVGLMLSNNGYDRERGLQFQQRLADRLSALPGVEMASIAEDVPLGFEGGSWEDLQIEGYVPQPSENMRIYRNLVAPGYFRVLRIPILEGRDFEPADDERAPLRAIVNQTFVRRFFGGRTAIGRTLRAWGARELTVVGVAADSKYASLNEAPRPYLYVPLRQFYRSDTGLAIHIRTAADPAALIPAIRGEIQTIDPAVMSLAIPLADYISASYFTYKVGATLLSALGALSLALAALGLYSMLAYWVAQRTPEIGIRMALGAQHGDIQRIVLSQGMTMTLAGIAAGAVLSWSVGARLLSTALYGVAATDVPTLAAAVALLSVVALLACWVPARRATRVDPLVALRHE
jgi:predicted permease